MSSIQESSNRESINEELRELRKQLENERMKKVQVSFKHLLLPVSIFQLAGSIMGSQFAIKYLL